MDCFVNPNSKSETVISFEFLNLKYHSFKEWYIVPLCKSCNNSTDEFVVSKNNLVRVIVKK